MKDSAAVIAVVAALAAGCVRADAPQTQSVVGSIVQTTSGSSHNTERNIPRPPPFILPSGPMEFDFGPVYPITNRATCTSFPELEHWAAKRNIDPVLVRAFAVTESGLDPNSSAKVCSSSAIARGISGCFPVGSSGSSLGYERGFDEMYDPAGVAQFAVSPNSGSATPDWRWLSFGIMATMEPPYTFWPAPYHPEQIDGPYFDILRRSGSFPLDLNAARDCNPRFNPFNTSDSACLGTGKMRRLMDIALNWIDAHRSYLNWGPLDRSKDLQFAAYIAANMYDGVWGSATRAPTHPRCSSGTTNGDCWAQGFSLSWSVDSNYCGSVDGQQDTDRCSNGRPNFSNCYGYTDFVQYVRNCEVPYLSRQADPGRDKMRTVYSIRASCP